MENSLEKVTTFITRKVNGEVQLLLFKHHRAGIQIPAGTVEYKEDHEKAAIREAQEETGYENFAIKNYIGFQEKVLPENEFVIVFETKVYARGDFRSIDWAYLKRGRKVSNNYRKENGFTHITFNEADKFPDPTYITYSITGWVPSENLATKVRRHFYHLEILDTVSDSWEQFADNELFKFFWAPISNLPDIVEPQNQYVKYVIEDLNYKFV